MKRKSVLWKLVGMLVIVAAVWVLRGSIMHAFHQWQVDAVLRDPIKGKLMKFSMPSRDMKRRNTFFIYLPPGYYQSDQRYPVVYLLHGCPGAGRDWFVKGRAHRTADELILTKRIRPVILVSPDGFGSGGPRDHSEWLNSAFRDVQAENYLATELPRYIDSHFRTIRSPNARALIGLSSGGYGAVNVGTKHQDVYGVLAAHSGYFDPDLEVEWVTHMLGPKGPRWDENNPLKQIDSWRDDKRIHIYMDCGRGDDLYPDNKQFADDLTKYGIGHVFKVTHGGHWWSLWRKQLRESLEYADGRFSRITSD